MQAPGVKRTGTAVPNFTSENIRIAYEVYGHGKPVLLIHGFASNGAVNWVETGWVETLTDTGYQAITIDNRGHGLSEKPYDPAVYSSRLMAHDAINLLDHLGIEQAALLGYSMGARISAFACLDAPGRVGAVVFGGLGINIVKGMANSAAIVEGLLAPSLSEVTDRDARQFRIFAEHTGSDLRALAACMAPSRDRISAEDIETIEIPALVAVGSQDNVAGDPGELAALLPQGELAGIARRDHMRATGDKQFKAAVLDFLGRVN